MTSVTHVAKEIACAGVGCAFVDGLFNPLEVLKVRLQAQVANDKALGSSVRALRIVHSEGLWNVWASGLLPTVLRSLGYVGFRIGMYPTVKRTLSGGDGGPEPFRIKLLAGAVCGGIGSALFSPIDLIALRFKADRLAYPNTFVAFATILRADGMAGLWQGCSANVARATLLSGTQLSVYDHTKALLRNGAATGLHWGEGPVMHMVAALVAGTVAQLAVMPVDALKTALMLPQSHRSAGGSALARAARQLYAAQGVRAFYRGLLPALLRQGPSQVVQMPLIEQLRRCLGLDYL